jgi:hypothetical protein
MSNKHCAPDSGQRAVPPSDAAVSASCPQLQPAFLRLPRSGSLCWFSGLSRSQLWLLVKSGCIKSHSLKRAGTRRGVRLIEAASLVSYLQRCPPAEQTEALEGKESGE